MSPSRGRCGPLHTGLKGFQQLLTALCSFPLNTEHIYVCLVLTMIKYCHACLWEYDSVVQCVRASIFFFFEGWYYVRLKGDKFFEVKRPYKVSVTDLVMHCCFITWKSLQSSAFLKIWVVGFKSAPLCFFKC